MTQTKTKTTVSTVVGVVALTALAFGMLGFAAYSAVVGMGAETNSPSAKLALVTQQPRSSAPSAALTASASKTEEPLPVDRLLDSEDRPSYVPGEVIVTLRSAATPQQEALTSVAAIQAYSTQIGLGDLFKKYQIDEVRAVYKKPKPFTEQELRAIYKNNERLVKWRLRMQGLFVQKGFDKIILLKSKDLKSKAEEWKKETDGIPSIPPAGGVASLRVEGNLFSGRVSATDIHTTTFLNELKNHPRVAEAQLNYLYYITATPTDPLYTEMWSLNNMGQQYPTSSTGKATGIPDADIDAPESWDKTTKAGEGVVVAVIDTGIDYNHPDINDNIWVNPGEDVGKDGKPRTGDEGEGDGIIQPEEWNGKDDDGNGYTDDLHGWSFYSLYNNNPIDGHGHGTHVAGTIVAESNAEGIVGVAYKAKVVGIKGLDNNGSGTTAALASAVWYAGWIGADITNNSWGGSQDDFFLKKNFDDIYSAGVTSIVAAGNSSSDALAFVPAKYDSVITVSASDSRDLIASFSNFGPKIDVAAPGVDVLSLRANGTDMYGGGTHIYKEKYYIASGTSMASPHVAGVAAVVKSEHPEYSPEEIRQVLRMGSDDKGNPDFDKQFGYGRLNLSKVLSLNSPCIATLLSPTEGEMKVQEPVVIPITGMAYCREFSKYTVEYGLGKYPTLWTTIATSSTPTPSIESHLALLDRAFLTKEEYYTIKLTVFNGEGQAFIDRVSFVNSGSTWKTNLPDVQVNLNFVSSPLLSDLNKDGNKEIVVFDGLRLHAIDMTGKELQGFPISVRSNAVFMYASIAIGDLDSNGDNEIVIGPGVESGCNPGSGKCVWSVLAYNHDGSYLSGWPVNLTIPTQYPHGGSSLSPVIFDLDNDETSEVITPLDEGMVGIWHVNGKSFSGWPKQIFYPTDRATTTMLNASPAVGDVDEDGIMEIIFLVKLFHLDTSKFETAIVVAESNGTIQTKWTVPWFAGGAPSLADIDGDNDLEIFIGSDQGKLYAWHHDGNPVHGWPQSSNSSNVSLGTGYTKEGASAIFADIDQNDAGIEVIASATNGEIYAWHKDGSRINGWPIITDTSGLYAGLITGDINDDLKSEIVGITTWAEKMFAFNGNGTLLQGWPKIVPGVIQEDPAIGDIDNDGDIDVITVSNQGWLYYWDEKGKYKPEFNLWPMARHDPQHTGHYERLSDILGDVDGNRVVDTGDVALIANHLNKVLELTEPQQARADANANERVDRSDWLIVEAVVEGAISQNSLPLMLGDITGDKLVDNADTALMGQYLKGDASLTPSQLLAADVNANKRVETSDRRIIDGVVNTVIEIDQKDLPLILGDMNSNEVFDTADVDTITLMWQNQGTYQEEQWIKADLTANNRADKSDVLIVNIMALKPLTSDEVLIAPILIGDVTLDTKITSDDPTLLRAYIKGSATITLSQKLAADANADETITATDANIIGRVVNGNVNQKDIPLDLADLAIIKAKITPAFGKLYRYYIVVANSGGVQSGVFVLKKKAGVRNAGTKKFASLAPLESRLIVGFAFALPVTLTLDPQNLIKELKEDNNTITITTASPQVPFNINGFTEVDGP